MLFAWHEKWAGVAPPLHSLFKLSGACTRTSIISSWHAASHLASHLFAAHHRLKPPPCGHCPNASLRCMQDGGIAAWLARRAHAHYLLNTFSTCALLRSISDRARAIRAGQRARCCFVHLNIASLFCAHAAGRCLYRRRRLSHHVIRRVFIARLPLSAVFTAHFASRTPCRGKTRTTGLNI